MKPAIQIQANRELVPRETVDFVPRDSREIKLTVS